MLETINFAFNWPQELAIYGLGPDLLLLKFGPKIVSPCAVQSAPLSLCNLTWYQVLPMGHSAHFNTAVTSQEILAKLII